MRAPRYWEGTRLPRPSGLELACITINPLRLDGKVVLRGLSGVFRRLGDNIDTVVVYSRKGKRK